MNSPTFEVTEGVNTFFGHKPLDTIDFNNESAALDWLNKRNAIKHQNTRDGVFDNKKPYFALVKRENEITTSNLGFFQIH